MVKDAYNCDSIFLWHYDDNEFVDIYDNMMNELCMIVWYEELGVKSCFMEKWYVVVSMYDDGVEGIWRRNSKWWYF